MNSRVRNSKCVVTIFFTLLLAFGTFSIGYADIINVPFNPPYPLYLRTQQVQDAIVAAVPGVNNAANVTDAHLAQITRLNLSSESITSLALGDFEGLTALTYINLNKNNLSDLPSGIFDNLSALERLYMGGNAFTSLPSGIFDNLSALTTLYLNYNAFTSLPSDIFDNLSALKTLALDNNPFTSLPSDIFDNLSALTTLALDNNPFTSLPSDIFDNLSALRELYLSNNAFTSLPSGIFDNLSALGKLYLNNNAFTSLPSDIFDNLSVLEELYLSYNAFTSFPSGIFDNLTTLHMLDLSGNDITSFPSGIFDNLTNMWWLNLGYNAFTSFPSGVFDKLSNLGTLGLNFNDITDASGLEGLPRIRHLFIGYNPLSDYTPLFRLKVANPGMTIYMDLNNIPPVFSEGDSTTRSIAENTAEGTIIGNAISATDTDGGPADLVYWLGGTDADSFNIDSSTGQLETRAPLDNETKASYSVTVFVTNGNGGDSIDVTINVTDVLDDSDLLYGRTQQVVNAIVEAVPGVDNPADVTEAHLAAITQLSMAFSGSGSAIRSLKSGDFNGLTALTRLGLGNNRISDLSALADLTTLTELYLDNNRFLSDLSALKDMTSLTTLHLYNNSISDISALTDMTELTELHISNNSISDISALAGLTALKELNMTYNSISNISALAGLTALTELFLSNNSISGISALENLTALTRLGLSNNSISDISALQNMTDLTRLGLSNNSISDISALQNMTALISLNLSNNTISDVSVLEDLDALKSASLLPRIYVSGNPISDYGPLRRLKAANRHLRIDIDINNNPPVFIEGTSATRSVAENTVSGTYFGTPVVATDLDNDTLTYTLGGKDAASFSIVTLAGFTGRLETKAALDYETKTSYTVTVSVTDGNGGMDSITITIYVENDLLDNRTQQVQDAIVAAVPGVNNSADVTAAHLASITSLSIEGNPFDQESTKITSLKSGDFNGLTALTSLSLKANSISDISALEDLTSLTTLILSHNSISDISVLQNLTALTTLSLYENSISDISVLEDLTSLTTLILSRNSISDISVLEDLTSLTTLNLYENSISNISALEDLTSLTYLNMHSNSISDISALENLTALTFLRLYGNSISNISALENLTALTHLGLSDNSISDVSALENLTALTYLNMHDNSISDISALKNLTSVRHLTLSSNSISDVSALENLTSLVSLHLVDNPISDYGPLRRLKASSPNLSIDIDIDNNPPAFIEGTHTTRSVAENTVSGTYFGTPVVATDLDNDTLTYTLGGKDAASFSIVTLAGFTGRLETKAALDYETKTSYTVTVSVSDGNDGMDSITITIYITDDLLENRTQQVQDAIVAAVPGVNITADVTQAHLAAITELSFYRTGITSLKSGDFDGLTSLTSLEFLTNSITSLPSDIFKGLSNLTELEVVNVPFRTLPVDIFDDLTSLTSLTLAFNQISSIPAGVFSNLTSLTTLQLSSNPIRSLPTGVFDNLTSLTNLYMWDNFLMSLPDGVFNKLSSLEYLGLNENYLGSLPDGVFSNLTSLTELKLHNNTVDPLLLTVSLEKVGSDQFKAVAPTAAPFDIVIPLTVTNGRITGGATTITIAKGNVESGTLIPTRTPGTTAAVTVNIGTLPGLPSDHQGYTLVKSTDLPLVYTDLAEDTFVPVSNRTARVQGAIIDAVRDVNVNSAADVTEAHLASIVSLDLTNLGLTELKVGDFAGLSGLIVLGLNNNGLTSLPVGVFKELSSLNNLVLHNNRLSSLSSGVFDGLSALTQVHLNNNRLTTLPDDVFDELSALRELFLQNNQLTSLSAGAFNGLSSLRQLLLNNNQLTTLPADVFDGLSSLREIWLELNQLTSLPAGVFERLSALDQLYLGGNSVNPIPLSVSLEKVADGQFKAVAPIGAPFDIVLPISVTDGSISGGATTIIISKASVESGTFTVTRTAGTTAAVTVDIGTLPRIPSGHSGYDLQKSNNLPLTVLADSNTAPVFTDGATTTRSIAENTASGQHIGTSIAATDVDNHTLTYTLGGTDATAFSIDSTTGHLKTSVALDYETKALYSITITVSDGNGGTDTITVTINVTDVHEIPITPVSERTSEVRDAIVKAVPNVSNAANVTAAHVAAITNLNLRNAGITALQTGDFSGMTALTSINLFNNQLSSLPDGIFAGLTSLTTIRLGRNTVDPLPIIITLEKVANGQFKAVAPAGALFNIVLPITVTNGIITSGATTLTIPHGNVESDTLTVTRAAGTTADVTVDIGTLPSLPRNHYGYALVKSDKLPITIISGTNTAPAFTDGASTTRSIAENTAAGQEIGTAVSAKDVENDTLTYTLSGTDASAFDIDSTTGQLKTKSALDYETKSRYTVTITVSDGSLTGTITVTISVSDIDEVVTPPITPDPPTTNVAPEFLEGDSTTRIVLENTAAGENIGNSFIATDANNDLLAYTLGGVDADSFDLESSGQLKTKAPLDYETKRVYTVTITVDDEELSNTITVIISVIDVNDTVISLGFVPVADRTPEVRDAIVTAVPNVTVAANVTESQVASITSLNLRGKGIAKLKTGDFSGMKALTSLNLFRNNLSRLPPGIFDGLTALRLLRLGGNVVDPIPLIVSLQQVGDGQFKAVMTTGAPFNIVLPMSVTNGSISGGVTSVTIPKGSMESPTFTVSGTSPIVAIGTLPRLPTQHFGYTLALSNVCNRTKQVADAIAKAAGVSDCSAVTEVDFATITSLDLTDASITSLNADDFAGMFSLKTLYLGDNALTSLPDGVFDDLVSLRELFLNDNKLTTLPSGLFSNLTSLTNLYLQSNDLSTLPSDAFEGLSSLRAINLPDNDLTSLPGGIFDGMPYLSSISLSNNNLTSIPNGLFKGLTQLSQLHLSWNPTPAATLSLTVTLEKVGTNQFKAVAPTGAPFAMTLPITVTNGRLAGGANAIIIPTGSVESRPITVIRSPGTVTAVTADIGTALPTLPSTHIGYAIVKAATLPLEVLPQLNSPPVFSEGVNTVRAIAENTAADTKIGDPVTATDQDANDTLTYTLGGTDAAKFTIDSKTGQIKTEAALDYETETSYTVTITVSDGLATDVITVTINVTDIDENRAPVFTEGASTTRTVAENTLAGTNIGTPIGATDVDKDTLTYSLSGTDASAFGIDTTTGQLKTSAALDYETKAIYSVFVTVSDGKITDIITVTINVTDVADETTEDQEVNKGPGNNTPVFRDGSSTTRSVSEDAATGVDIGTPIAATDADGHTITYTLGGTDAASFTIDSTSGQLRTNTALDYETKSTYTVTITASDGTDQATITVTINVVDATENRAPVFTVGSTTTRSVAENTGSGVDIGSAIAATDADGDTLTYTLGGTDAASFSIDSTSGQLRTDAFLDYETKSTYTVTITVSDGTLTDSISVTINITDVEETPENSAPVFGEGSSASRSVDENAVSGTDIGSAVSATDANGDTLSYSLSGTDASSFSIDSSSGQISTSASLDYETEDSYSVTVNVSDGQGGISSISVTISVTDVNDAPVFTDGSTTTRSIAENTAANTDIGTAVSATDEDDDTLTYTLGGIDAASFSIVSTSGQLQTQAALDYENKTTYSVVITASDGSLTASITVTINVTSVNEAPTFTDGTATTRQIAENVGANINIGSAVAATDPDGDTLTYTLGGTDAESFEIDSTNGQLKTKAALDFETKTTYTVTITAADGNGGTDAISVTVNVTDLDETPSNNPPVFTDGASTTRSVAENTESGTNIGTPVAATDEDENTLAYQLSGTDASSFSIVSTSGQLQTNASLDHETQSSYTVTVTVTDGSSTDTITVTINVTDANDAPEFTDGANTTRSIAENTATSSNIGDAVAATDEDEDTLNYTLGGTDSASFSIVSTSGQLRTKAALDYEEKTSYAVTITVSDEDGGSDSINIIINVTNVNEPPNFSSGSATVSIAENSAQGTNIGAAFSATDPDSGDTLTYSLQRGDASSFSIDSSTGQLSVNAALNYETKNSYTNLAVRATDSAGSIDAILVTVNVTDVNEAPTFSDDSPITLSVAENTVSGQNIGAAVAATDPDTNDSLTYTLGGTDASSFSIVSTSGQLRTKADLDYEQKTSYALTITVSDSNLTDTINVTINVTDVQENRAPTFTGGSSTTRSVAENTASGQDIGTAVAATDADKDTLNYTLGGTDSASFSINGTTGQLRTNAALNYEDKTSYSVTVSVSDGNGGSDSINVTIDVTNVNEAPSFGSGASISNISATVGTAITSVTLPQATDPDANTTLTYTLTTPPTGLTFTDSTRVLSGTPTAETASATYTYKASDGTLSATLTFSIEVSAPPNNAPEFTDGTATTRSVAENTASSTSFGTAVTATDEDNDALTYTLGGTDASSFSIVSTSGQLQTNAALNYETTTSYTVTVDVSDGNGGSDSIDVTINVTNVNEVPSFGSASISNISATVGTAITSVTLPQATDPDANTTLTYTLTTPPAGLTFTDSTRVLSGTPEAETASATYTYTASDGALSATLTFSIEVSAPPNNAPEFTDGSTTSRSVAENTASGTSFGTAVAATDEDNDTLTYTLGGTDASSFSIVSTSGQLQTSAALDYETTTSYTVTVSVSDSKGGSDNITVTINVTDVTDTINPALSARTQQVREAIVAAVPGVTNAKDVTATHLAAITTLSFHNKGITSLQNGDFNGLSALRTLNITNDPFIGANANTLSTLPADIFSGLTSLETLNLWALFITTLPSDVFDGLSSLQELNLSGNFTPWEGKSISYLSNLSSDLFEGLSSLQTLEIRTRMTNLPSDLFDEVSTNLTSLELNLLDQSFPEDLFDGLSSLTSLSFSSASTSLPEDLFDELSSLTSLSVSSASTSYPEDLFDGLSSLTSLSMRSDSTTFPEGLFDDLSSLTNLSILSFTLTSLPSDVFDELTSLTTLTVIGTKLTSLPSGVFDELTSLTTLSLRDNRTLSSLPSGVFDELTSLTSLNLNKCSITDVSELEELTSLQTLYLSGNTISDYGPLRRLIAAIDKIEDHPGLTLNITIPPEFTPVNQRTQQVQDAIVAAIEGVDSADDVTAAHVATITSLSITQSPLEFPISYTALNSSDFTGFTALTSLSLQDSKINDISGIAGLTNLTTLYLREVSVRDISAIEDLTNLTTLNVVSLGISDISAIEGLTNLTTLYLSANRINDISALEDLTNLTTLSLHQNHYLSDISTLEDLTELTTLYLGSNSISDVSALEDLTNLRSLRLDGNPIPDYGPLRRLKTAIEAAGNSITIDIDLNNNPPVFKDGESTTLSVAENTASGTNIGTAIAATDEDGDTLLYRLKGNEASYFSIDRTSGQLQTRAALDYETKSSYTPVIVDVTDGHGGKDRITVTINVTDVAGAAPSVETSPIIPDNTDLLTNFPNPFNPETWIPYQLAKPAEVTLTIYNMRGVVVRTITLGHKAAGMYTSRSRAIHWDGRNSIGEKVATGVYFYTLKAGEFTATRKMLIRK